ncbi:MAG: DUF2924 domain-containing protein, partial [Sedimentisphaerales bacterium]|nr:DUF2924 domain-containing protein [Sedimentisphaerales bacterium]
ILLVSFSTTRSYRYHYISFLSLNRAVVLTEDIKTILDELLGRKSTTSRKKKKKTYAKTKRPLKDIFPGGKVIYASYKGRDYKAWVSSIGRIRYAGTRYDTPTEAAKAIVNRGAINGWGFWRYKDKSGNLVKLRNARKRKTTTKRHR